MDFNPVVKSNTIMVPVQMELRWQVLHQSFLAAECLILQASHTFSQCWVCVISLLYRWQTETKMQESHHVTSHWLLHDSPAGLVLFSDVNSIMLEKQNNWEYWLPNNLCSGTRQKWPTACANYFPMYLLTTITAQQKSLGLLYPRFCRRYDLVRILPNLTSCAPPGSFSLSSTLVLLPYPPLHLASVLLSRQRALSLCTAVGLPPSFPPSLSQVLALVSISFAACSPQYQQRSTSGSTSRLWCTALQWPCQHRKTMSKSCCSALAAGGCSVPAITSSLI